MTTQARRTDVTNNPSNDQRPADESPPDWTQRYNLYQDTWQKIGETIVWVMGWCLTIAAPIALLTVTYLFFFRFELPEKLLTVALLMLLAAGFLYYLIDTAPERPKPTQESHPGEPT